LRSGRADRPLPVVVHYVEHMPPDVTAGILWLKNRDPENWRDVQNVDHVLGKYIISDRPMTEEGSGDDQAALFSFAGADSSPAESAPMSSSRSCLRLVSADIAN
jgi:hypothetical protein